MQALLDQLFKLGKEKGFEEQEVSYSSNKTTSVQVYRQEIAKMDLSKNGGLSYRGIVDGKMGYSYTEKIDEESMLLLIEQAYENAQIIENDDKVFLFDGKGYGEYQTFPTLSEAPEITMEERVNIPMTIEKVIRENDKIIDVTYNTYQEVESELLIKNTLGLNLSHKNRYYLAYAQGIIADGDKSKNYFDGQMTQRHEDIDSTKIGEDILMHVSEKIGASSVKSGIREVVMNANAFASLFMTFLSQFSAENVQKGLSPLKGKVGEMVAAECLTLEDDPHLEGGIATTPFDAEGVPTRSKYLIQKGKLNTFLYNLTTAHKDGVQSTGNASKRSYKSAVEISPFNLVFSTGEKSLEQLMASVGEGILITSLAGLHSGVNPMSGNFSLQAEGFLIQKGKKTKPVNQITMAGNFYEMLLQIKEMGADRQHSIHHEMIYTPSVHVGKLSISGE